MQTGRFLFARRDVLWANIANTLRGKKTALTRSVEYNSAESEPICMKSGTVWAKCWGLSRQILGAIRAVATVWARAEIFVFFVMRIISHDFTDFPLDKFYEIWTQQRRSVSLCELSEKIWKFYHNGFFPKKAKIVNKISRSCDFRPS